MAVFSERARWRARVRLSYQDADGNGLIAQSEIREENNYYPFGLQHRGYNNVINGTEHPYKFMNVELEESLGLNFYETSFRFYDPSIGIFRSIDRLAEKLVGITPYNYSYNSPILYGDPTGLFPDGPQHNTSTFIDRNGKVLEHRDDGDPRVYWVQDIDEWEKNGKKKDGLPIIGYEDPNRNYKKGDQYTWYHPSNDELYQGQYMVPSDAYDYTQESMPAKQDDDMMYILYGNEGSKLSRFWDILLRDINAEGNGENVTEASLSVLPLGIVFKKLGKGYSLVSKIGGKGGKSFYRFEKVVKASNLSGQARAVYVKIYNNSGKLVKMYKDTYRIDGRFLHRRFLKPNQQGLYLK
ncbi:RHS repeat domain-containing protein [Flavobacteriaceae bacterium M23B6Z8]